MDNSKYVITDFGTFIRVMNILLPIGAIISAPITGSLVTGGRRNAMIIVSTIFMFACLLTTIFNFFTIFIGRLIMGFCFGSYLTLVPLMVCELSPGPISGPLGVIGQIQGMTGLLISSVLQFSHPYSNDALAKQSLMWKIALGLPVASCLIQIIMLCCVYNFDSPKFYNIHGDVKGYQNAMSRLYNGPTDSSKTGLLEDGSLPMPEKKRDLSWGEILTSPNNRPVIIGVLFAFFHQASGMSSVSFVSNQLFTRDIDGSDAEYAARTGALLNGIAGICAAITGFIAANYFGRRIIILSGELVMCIVLAILSNTSLLHLDFIGKVCDVIYVYAFNASLGSMLWLYVSETNGPKGISMAAVSSSVFTLVFMLFTEFMFNLFTEVGIYFNLFFLQILCVAFMYIFVKETRDCTDKDRLYYPDEYKQVEEKDKELDEF
mmetsp:Transcript_10638/g.11953  ORF Transcript_10638/g.11953 Transcript_10638/m.11953 type:complete len:433 (-) Transcript_10638:55-1353(-)